MDEVKQAFIKVKQDIFSLGNEIQFMRLSLGELQSEMRLISSFINDLKLKLLEKPLETPKSSGMLIEKETSAKEILNISTPTQEIQKPTIRHINPTHPDIPTDKLLSQVLRSQKLHSSTGNRGVPTDRQTDQQTDRHIIQHINIRENPTHNPPTTLPSPPIVVPKIELKETRLNHIEKAAEILDSLDALKKEIRRKFKALTPQEMSVFSLIYQLEDQGEIVDYPLLSSKLNLSESSIRDYILKIQKKGIPITKEKQNNKRILLHISLDLKKIASLDTIIRLREI